MRLPRPTWIVVALLLLVRAAALAASVHSGRPLAGDEPTYDGVARSLLAGEGFRYAGAPWVWKPPLWPALLAAIRFCFGHGIGAAVFVQGLCDAGTAIVAYHAARRIFGGERAGWIALALVALWPPFIRESRLLQTEPLFTFTVALSMYMFMRWAEKPDARRAFALGLAAGLAAMVRPNGLAPAAGLVIGWLVLDRVARAKWPTLAAVVLGAALVMAPWAARNARVFHHFIPFSIGGGEVFAMGTSVATGGRWDHVVWVQERERELRAEALREGHELDAAEKEAALYRMGLRRWRENPGEQLGLWLLRLGRTVALPVELESWWLRMAFLGTLVCLYALAAAGAAVGWCRAERVGRTAPALLVSYAINVLLLSTIAASSRYTEPVRTLPIVLAAGALAAWSAARGAKR